MTKLEIALKIIEMLKKENQILSSLNEDYKPNKEDLDNMIFWSELLNNKYLKEE